MEVSKEVYENAASRVIEGLRNNSEEITNLKKNLIKDVPEDVSREFGNEFGFKALESYSDEEKLNKLLWINGSNETLFSKLERGPYEYHGSLFPGQAGTFVYLGRYDPNEGAYSLGGRTNKDKLYTSDEVLEEINWFISGLKEADTLINELDENSSIKDYENVYDAVINKIKNNSMCLVLNKYFSLLYPKKWTKFIGKRYGIRAVEKLLGIKVKGYAEIQYHLMHIQNQLVQSERITPLEFMFTYDSLWDDRKSESTSGQIPLIAGEQQGYIYEDYEPGLSSDEWLDILNDEQYTNNNQLVSLKRFLDFGGEATCTELSRKYGQSWQFYRNHSTGLATTLISDKMVDPPEVKDGKSKYWPVLFTGRYIKDSKKGIFSWKLREELQSALEEMDLTHLPLYTVSKQLKDEARYSFYSKKLLASKNVIFRGAPGTGKTYLARQIAAEIISGGRTSEFDELSIEEKERFEFVQFHPSYDYTDFVEGYRPIKAQDNQMGFELMPGIFKQFLNNAIESQVSNDDKPHVFVIDEINRGEISKIFGELFFAIDPGYRGKEGAVKTQYSSLQNAGDKLYIPENVYIIGTMNDIDRSVENFDFAMRRRFRFIEIKADDEEQLKMLNDLEISEEAAAHLKRLNDEISATENLNDHYHIGPSYFLKLKELNNDFELLWEDYLEPLLEEYVRGFFDEKEILEKLKKAYDGNGQSEVIQDDTNEDYR